MNCEAHWLFASYYYRVSNNIPDVIEIGTISAQKVKKYKLLYWTGIVINAALPALEGCFAVWFFVGQDKSSEMVVFVGYGLSVSVIGICLCLITSGVILIYSVIKIKRYMNNRTGNVDSRTLVVHSTSFAIYTLAICLATAAYIAYISDPNSVFIKDMFAITSCCQAGL